MGCAPGLRCVSGEHGFGARNTYAGSRTSTASARAVIYSDGEVGAEEREQFDKLRAALGG